MSLLSRYKRREMSPAVSRRRNQRALATIRQHARRRAARKTARGRYLCACHARAPAGIAGPPSSARLVISAEEVAVSRNLQITPSTKKGRKFTAAENHPKAGTG